MQLIGLTGEELEQQRSVLQEKLRSCRFDEHELEGSLISALDEIDFAPGEIQAGRPSPLR
jgi:hypothetical protein